MPITTVDLLSPKGPIEPRLFPGESVDLGGGSTALGNRLQEYIDQAEAKVAGTTFPDQETEDNAVREWALHLAFKAAYMVAVSRPSSENSMVQVIGSETYSKDQRDALREAAAIHESNFNLVIASLPLPTQPQSGYHSQTTPIVFEW